MNEKLSKKLEVYFLNCKLIWVSLFVLWNLSHGCTKSKQSEVNVPTDIQMMENEPEFRIDNFMVLKTATREATLPYVSSGDGSVEEATCFVPQNKLTPWQTTNVDILEMMATNRTEIHEIMSTWINETFRESAGEALDNGFEMKLKRPMIVHVPESKTRLVEDQDCIRVKEGVVQLPQGVITTLFGSRVIELKNKEPLSPETIKTMRKAAKTLGMRLQATPAEYPRARDEQGNPQKDEKGRPLFVAPGGAPVLRANIPKPKNRPIYKWKLKLGDPLYFAAGDLPEDSWATEIVREKCDAYLVFDEATPHVLECGEPEGVGFGITRSDKAKEVVVKITVDGQTNSKSIRFKKRTPIVSAGRVLTWIRPKEVEEGARIFVDSVMLFPTKSMDGVIQTPSPTDSAPKKPKTRSGKSNKNKETKPSTKEEKKEEAPPPPMPVY